MCPQITVRASVPYEMDCHDRPTYARWIDRVDTLVWSAVDCSLHDLPDCNLMEWYEDRLRPSRAAARAINEAF